VRVAGIVLRKMFKPFRARMKNHKHNIPLFLPVFKPECLLTRKKQASVGHVARRRDALP
jgi:hypothetical protein